MRGVVAVLLLAACGRWGFDADRTGSDAAIDSAVDGAIDAPDRANRMFVTKALFSGGLGGLAGADAKCQAEADAVPLGGRWVALLNTDADDPAARVAGSRGWVDVTGTPIADMPADLLTHQLHPVRVDADGNRVSGYAHWGGHPPASQTCMDWTSTGTDPFGTLETDVDAAFRTDVYLGTCANTARLICAEIGHVAVVAPPLSPGREVFVTRGMLPGNMGLANADMLCNTEAAQAQLPGTYRAFLTMPTATAESRLSATGLPWRRVKSTLLAPTAAALVGATPIDPWDSFVGAYADGEQTNARVWVGTMADNCSGWSSASSTVNGRWGPSNTTRRNRLGFALTMCNNTYPLLCFQE